MKKILFTGCCIILGFVSDLIFAQAITLKVSKDGSTVCGTSNCLGQVDPCQSLLFTAFYSSFPDGYDQVNSYEWYENSNSSPSSVGDAFNNAFQPYANNANSSDANYHVKCVIRFKNSSNGSISGPYTSNSFDITIKPAALNNIIKSSDAILGCTNQITYSTNLLSGQFYYTPPAGSYQINWQIPTGWTFNSPNTGNSITVTPSATGTGSVKATLKMLPCAYSSAPTSLTISRTTPSPIFTGTSPQTICNISSSSTTFSVSNICGAVSYTYTLSGNPSCVFTSNGSQTLTSTATSVSVNFPTGNYTMVLSCKANYTGGLSSSAATKTIYAGVVFDNWTDVSNICRSAYREITHQVAPNFTGYTFSWKVLNNSSNLYNDGSQIIGTSTSNKVVVDYMRSGRFTPIVTIKNSCNQIYTTGTPVIITLPCTSLTGLSLNFSVYPNPVKTSIVIKINESSEPNHQSKKYVLKYYTLTGILAKTSYINSNSGIIYANVSDLKPDNYFLEINDGISFSKKQIVIQK